MPPKAKQYVANFIVLDVGATSSGSGYFEQARKVASQFVQRKIYAEESFRYGLVLVGTVRSDNDLGYDRVSVIQISDTDLVQADFGLVKFLETEVPNYVGRDVEDTDWLSGLAVAVDRLIKATENSPGCTGKRIIMMTDMGCKVNERKGGERLCQVSQLIRDHDIEVTFIVPDWIDDSEEPRNDDAAGKGNNQSVDDDAKNGYHDEGENGGAAAAEARPGPSRGTPSDGQNKRKPMTKIQKDGHAKMKRMYGPRL